MYVKILSLYYKLPMNTIKLSENNLRKIPIEVLMEILKTLPVDDLVKFMRSSKFANKIIAENNLMKLALTNKYKEYTKMDLLDEISNNLQEDYIIPLLEVVFIINPSIITSSYFIKDVLKNANNGDILKFLFEKGLDPNKKIDRVSLLEYVIIYINNLNERDWSDDLKEVASYREEILITLLENGLSPNLIANKNGYTVMHILVRGRSIMFLELFLQYKGDPNAKNKEGNTVFLEMCKNENKLSFKDMLHYINIMIKYGADIEATNNERKSCNIKLSYLHY